MGDQGSNGNVKWWQLVTVMIGLLSIVGSITVWGINSVAANDRRREDSDKEISSCLYGRLGTIDSRLARIEERLNIDERNTLSQVR